MNHILNVQLITTEVMAGVKKAGLIVRNSKAELFTVHNMPGTRIPEMYIVDNQKGGGYGWTGIDGVKAYCER